MLPLCAALPAATLPQRREPPRVQPRGPPSRVGVSVAVPQIVLQSKEIRDAFLRQL